MGTRGFVDDPEPTDDGFERLGGSTASFLVGGCPSKEEEDEGTKTDEDIGRLDFEDGGGREEEGSGARAPENRAVNGFFGVKLVVDVLDDPELDEPSNPSALRIEEAVGATFILCATIFWSPSMFFWACLFAPCTNVGSSMRRRAAEP